MGTVLDRCYGCSRTWCRRDDPVMQPVVRNADARAPMLWRAWERLSRHHCAVCFGRIPHFNVMRSGKRGRTQRQKEQTVPDCLRHPFVLLESCDVTYWFRILSDMSSAGTLTSRLRSMIGRDANVTFASSAFSHERGTNLPLPAL
jgi:hypothetical protein